jgi:hypothetical protein
MYHIGLDRAPSLITFYSRDWDGAFLNFVINLLCMHTSRALGRSMDRSFSMHLQNLYLMWIGNNQWRTIDHIAWSCTPEPRASSSGKVQLLLKRLQSYTAQLHACDRRAVAADRELGYGHAKIKEYLDRSMSEGCIIRARILTQSVCTHYSPSLSYHYTVGSAKLCRRHTYGSRRFWQKKN